MGACSINHVEELEASHFSRDRFNSYVQKDSNKEFSASFQDPSLSTDPLSTEDLNQYECKKKEIIKKVGRIERLPHIDAKFPNMSVPVGPFSNEAKTFTYCGSVKDTLPHGWGEAITHDGLYFIGYFDEGIPNYYGRYVCSDGSMYEGGLYRFTKDGYGRLTLPNGILQEGEWKFNSLFMSSHPSARDKKTSAGKPSISANTPLGSDPKLALHRQPIGDYSPLIDGLRSGAGHLHLQPKEAKSEPDVLNGADNGKPPVRSCLKAVTGERKPSERHISFVFPENRSN